MTTTRCLIAALLAAGCSVEGSDSPSSGPPAPIEGEEEMAAAWCETLVRCELYPDLEACIAALDVVGDDVRDAFEAGQVAYDPGAAAACAAALGAMSCEELAGAPDLADCDAWTGTVPDGGECDSGAACESGACDPGGCDPALACCPGTCVSPLDDESVQLGGDCTNVPCGTDAWCDLAAVPATCRPLAALDQPCAEGTCEADLYCRITDQAAGTGVCSGLPGEGEACDPDYPVCARADNWCDPVDNTCRSLAAVGEACDESADNCMPYAWCSAEGRCVARPGEGEPCLDWPPCLGDLECVDDTCAMPPIDEGEEDCG